jgi:thiol-disulfide isomerase/thioredoxin
MSQMGLQQQLDAFKAEFARTAPVGRPALYEAKIEQLRASFAQERAIRTGDQAPDFTLPDPQGRNVSLGTLLEAGPAVVTFYRGGWCPYCNMQLRAYQAVLPDMTRNTAGRDLAAAAGRLAVDRRVERTDLRRPQRHREQGRPQLRARMVSARRVARRAAVEQ